MASVAMNDDADPEGDGSDASVPASMPANAAAFDAFLTWSDRPLVKFGEWGLVVLLSVHLFFGLRVLAIEFLPWPGHLKRLIAAGAAVSLLVGAVFLMNVA